MLDIHIKHEDEKAYRYFGICSNCGKVMDETEGRAVALCRICSRDYRLCLDRTYA